MDTGLCGFRLCLLWGDVADGGVDPRTIVIAFDISEQFAPRGIAIGVFAVVLDAFSRRIVGWSMATTLATRLVLDALNMALMTRRPRGVIHHSDQGSQGGFN